jgi:integrase/recombinase XerC
MSRDDGTALALVGPPAALPVISDADLVREYLDSLLESTRTNYRKNMGYFAAHLGVHAPAAAVAILVGAGPANANRIALKYRTAMRGAGLKSATIANRLAPLRSVVAAFQAAGRITWTLHVKNPKVTKYRDTRGPGDEGWDAMRAIAKGDADLGTAKGIRDRAILRVDHDLGLRVGELVRLDLVNIEMGDELPTGVWVVRKGKPDPELHELPGPTAQALASWLLVRGGEPGPVFVRLDRAAKGPGRLTANAVYKIVDKLGQRAGITRRMSPHRLRHHAITSVCKRNNGNVVEAQAFSGHADLRTLAHYIDNAKDTKGKMAKLIADPD